MTNPTGADLRLDINHNDLPIIRLSKTTTAFHAWSSCGDVRDGMGTYRMCEKCFVKCIKQGRSMYGGEKYMARNR